MPDRTLTEADLLEIEALARENHSETYRGPLLALVDEVRRLRQIVLTARPGAARSQAGTKIVRPWTN